MELLDKKVLVISSGHSAQDHRVYDKVARTLIRHGAKVKIIAFYDLTWTDKDIKLLSIPKCRGRLERFLIQPWRCFKSALDQEGDVWHLHDAELLITVPLIRLLRPKARVIYDVHEDFPELLMIAHYLPEWIKPCLRRITHIVEKSLALTSHGIIGATQSLSDHFWNHERIGIYNLPTNAFLSIARIYRKPQRERQYDIVHLGALTEARARFLKDVIVRVAEKRPSVRVLITGVFAEILPILKAILPQCCELEGKVPYKDIPARLGNSRIGISMHPFPGRHLKVAVATKVFEYLACGCAVVATGLPEMKRLLGAGDLDGVPVRLLEGGDVETYANTILSILQSTFTQSTAGTVSPLDMNRDLTWDGQGERMVQFYQGILT